MSKAVWGPVPPHQRENEEVQLHCLGLGHDNAWWEASLDGYWPEGIPDDGSVQAIIELFESFGFICTDRGDVGLEREVRKVAIYGDAEGYTRTARQLPNGKWTSKMGKLQDIEHDSLDALTSVGDLIGTDTDRAYGVLVQIMRNDQELAK